MYAVHILKRYTLYSAVNLGKQWQTHKKMTQRDTRNQCMTILCRACPSIQASSPFVARNDAVAVPVANEPNSKFRNHCPHSCVFNTLQLTLLTGASPSPSWLLTLLAPRSVQLNHTEFGRCCNSDHETS